MKFDEPPPVGVSPRLYRVEFDGGFRYVEAASFGRALDTWRVEMMNENPGPDSGWDIQTEPDSIVLVDHEAVIRDQALAPR